MKYLKLAMNTSAAVFLALFCVLPVEYFEKSFNPCSPNYFYWWGLPVPSQFFFIGQFIVFSFLIYKTAKYLYLHFFEQKKFYVHLFLLSIPFLMFLAFAAWFYADIIFIKNFQPGYTTCL